MRCEKHNNDYHTFCLNCAIENRSTEYKAGPNDSYYPPGAKDMVNSPSHYTQGSIECIDAIAEVVKHLDGMEAMCTGNAIKYLWRWRHKNGVEDLKKAVWYIQRMIDEFDAN
jgi:Protein of unknwon function (DUF3310)